MTNGEKIQTILNVDRDCTEVHGENETMTFTVTQNFWNAKYKEPTTKNNLGVDWDELKRKILMEVDGGTDDAWLAYGEVCENISNSIDDFKADLPPVAPIRPKGHWISHGEHCRNLGVMPSGLGAYEWCSNCDCGIDVKEWYRSRYNYCPNCGADMREIEE
jgi:hypothetical protein